MWGSDVSGALCVAGSIQKALQLNASGSVRVLILVSEAPPIVSGVSRCVDRMVQGLQASGVSVDVLSSNEIRRWRFGEVRISSFIGRWGEISRDLDSYDVVNLHGPAPTMSDAFLALFRTRRSSHRPALVYTHHSCIDIDGLGPLCRIYDGLTARLSTLADRVVVTTPSYADMVRRPNGPPVEIVPWGVDAPPVPTRELTSAADPLRILFVGQLRPYKGVSVLIRAVAGRPELQLTIAGGGPLADAHRREAAETGAENVTFAGQVPDEALAQLYLDHDVIVLPSTTRAEAFGLVLLEGMAAGCVPVASGLPGVSDVARGTGVLVPPGDETALREALLSLAGDRERLWNLSESSRRAAQAQPWEAVGRAYARIFQNTLHEQEAATWTDAVRSTIRPADQRFPELAEIFDASWWSFVLFDDNGNGSPMARLGRIGTKEFRRQSPQLASYVARLGEPLLLDHESASEIRPMLTRPEIRSAMAVPVDMNRGTRGVVSLTAAGKHGRRYTERDLDALVQLMAS